MERLFTVLIAWLPGGGSADAPVAFLARLHHMQAAYLYHVITAVTALLPAMGPPNPSFYLVNHADQDITAVYVSPSTARGWGQNRLERVGIRTGGYLPVRLQADGTCSFDLRVVYDDRHSEERRNLNTCALDDVVFGDPAEPAPQDPSFRVVNRAARGIYSVYVRPAGTRDWGNDRLGDRTIDAESYRLIHMPAGQCLWDVRIVFIDQQTTEKRQLDLCSNAELRIQ